MNRTTLKWRAVETLRKLGTSDPFYIAMTTAPIPENALLVAGVSTRGAGSKKEGEAMKNTT